jgi:hypothetical protein
LAEELQTKSEFYIQVWADTHKTTIDNIGQGSMCLALIQKEGDGYIDQEFYDPVRKEKHTYQSRVYTGPIKLDSAFWPNSINTVNCSIWFQEDLPYPGVDLLKLKPKT